MKFLQLELTLALSAAALFNGCCTKKDCEDQVSRIQFYGFDVKDLDTICVAAYEPNGSSPVDSFVTAADNSSGTAVANLAGNISFSLVYSISLYGTSMLYRVSGFSTKREKCNTCFLNINQDYYDELNQYRVNNSMQSGHEIKIYK